MQVSCGVPGPGTPGSLPWDSQTYLLVGPVQSLSSVPSDHFALSWVPTQQIPGVQFLHQGWAVKLCVQGGKLPSELNQRGEPDPVQREGPGAGVHGVVAADGGPHGRG